MEGDLYTTSQEKEDLQLRYSDLEKKCQEQRVALEKQERYVAELWV
jgi:hypothetical protein